MNILKQLLVLFLVPNLVWASCVGPFCWDDTGAYISGVKFNGSFGGSSTPAGSDTQVQFNNNNSFGASSSFTWNGTILDIRANGALNRQIISNIYQIYSQETPNTALGGIDEDGNGNFGLFQDDPTKSILLGAKQVVVGGNAAVDGINISFAIQSSSGAFLPPLFTTAQRNGIQALQEGMIIINTSSHTIEFYNGSAWRTINTSAVN